MNASALELAGVFGDHMVPQRDTALRIWDRAEPGQRVEVQLGSRKGSSKAGPDGRWQAELISRPAGGPCKRSINHALDRPSLS